jgi:selenocysteine lyase/cysteine desulfurase
LISDLEHNAVLLPLHALAAQRGVSYDISAPKAATCVPIFCPNTAPTPVR